MRRFPDGSPRMNVEWPSQVIDKGVPMPAQYNLWLRASLASEPGKRSGAMGPRE
jgi:hypothetical protein